MKIVGADHTSFTVSNLERSLEFYVGLLGCKVLWQREITDLYFRAIVGIPDAVVKAAHLEIPGTTHNLELFEYVVPRGVAADVHNNNPGSSHLALYVDDLESAYSELKAKGVQFRSEPIVIDKGANTGGRSVYMLDPDGITVELFQPQ
jgi:catechol 2,3-dioxygenase-like lactoylglutathione lyase family enzyme